MAEIWERGDRGFHGYGREDLRDTYGGSARVYESSSAEGPHVWLNVESPELSKKGGEATLHMNETQVRDLIDRLQTWVDEIPTRWGR